MKIWKSEVLRVAFPTENDFLHAGTESFTSLSERPLNPKYAMDQQPYISISSVLTYISILVQLHIYSSSSQVQPSPDVKSTHPCRPLFLLPWGLHLSVSLVILVVVFIKVWSILPHFPLMISLVICS